MQAEFHDEANCKYYLDYSYHRHSARKNTVYFRCSDKKCPAKVHYDILTKQITLKNQHLSSALHKPPKKNQAITINQLCKQVQNTSKKIDNDINPEHDLECHENFELPSKHGRNVHEDNKNILIRFYTSERKEIDIFTRKILRKKIAQKVHNLTELTDLKEAIIEIECIYTNTQKVLEVIHEYFPLSEPTVYRQILSNQD